MKILLAAKMELSEYKNIYENEHSHYYYVGYHQIVISLLKKHLKSFPAQKKLKILDAGCGPGLLTKKLEQFGDVIGIDIHPEAIRFAKKRKVSVKKASVTKLPFKDCYFDVVVSLDVLNHIAVENDQSALKEIYRVLSSNGIFVLKLQAFNFLSGEHDKVIHFHKRYTRGQVQKMLLKSGFKNNYLTYIASFLFLPLAIKVMVEKLNNSTLAQSNVRKVWPILNSLLIFMFKIEDILINKFSLPIGISILAVSKK